MDSASADWQRRPKVGHKKSRKGCKKCKARRVKVCHPGRHPYFIFLPYAFCCLYPWPNSAMRCDQYAEIVTGSALSACGPISSSEKSGPRSVASTSRQWSQRIWPGPWPRARSRMSQAQAHRVKHRRHLHHATRRPSRLLSVLGPRLHATSISTSSPACSRPLSRRSYQNLGLAASSSTA